jgi:hypothetical protein
LPRANGQKLAFAGYLALRFMKASPALIAMQQDSITCCLELSGLGGCSGNDIFMAEIAETAVGMGARRHWGQFNDNIIEASYGDQLTRWRRVLAQMSRKGFPEEAHYQSYQSRLNRVFIVILRNHCGLEPKTS